MSYGTYAPRCYVHPDRYGVRKTTQNIWAVLHTSEGPEGENAAENLCGYMGQPGDRSNGRGGFYGSSYHVVFDTDIIRPAVPYETVSYSAGGGNAQGIHACFPGRAGQTREQWLDPISRQMIRQCAAWLCDIEDQFRIPVSVKMSVGEMQAYKPGLADHYTVTQAFRRSTHTDVGPGFPWDVLASDIAELRGSLQPPINPPTGVPDVFHPVVPYRNSDTRAYGGAGIAGGKPFKFGLDPAKIPANVKAVAMNVTAVNPVGPGFVTVWPGGAQPNTSCVNYDKGGATAGQYVGAVDGLSFFVMTSAQAHVLIDVTGYWTD